MENSLALEESHEFSCLLVCTVLPGCLGQGSSLQPEPFAIRGLTFEATGRIAGSVIHWRSVTDLFMRSLDEAAHDECSVKLPVVDADHHSVVCFVGSHGWFGIRVWPSRLTMKDQSTRCVILRVCLHYFNSAGTSVKGIQYVEIQILMRAVYHDTEIALKGGAHK